MRRKRGNAGRIVRLIGKWRHAGVRAEGVLTHPETGVVPGGVIAPGLANLCLHDGLDEWFAREVRPRRKGRCVLMRVADACVRGCELEADARKIIAGLPKRLSRLGLRMHPAKTALMAFRKPEAHQGADTGNGPGDFLGLTHDGTQSRQGCWVSKRRPARKRFRRTKKSLGRGCRTNRHTPLQYQYPM